MWFSKKKQPPIRSLIGVGTSVLGALHFTEGLRIDGEVIGDVQGLGDQASLLVISENARVQGKVIASHVIINGQVCGPVHSSELLELQPNARIVGDVFYAALEMHQGATIHGELHPHGSNPLPPVLKLVTTAEETQPLALPEAGA